MNIPILPNHWRNFPLNGFAADGITPAAITGILKVDDYTSAYVAVGSGLGAIVPKVVPAAGASVVVTVTMDANDAVSGTPLPEVSQTFEIFGPPLPGQVAFSAAFGAFADQTPIDTLHGTPTDPGSASVTF